MFGELESRQLAITKHPHFESLQLAIAKRQWEDAEKNFEGDPEVASAGPSFGDRPLHFAIRNGAPDRLVLALLGAYPRATCEYSPYRRLHTAMGAPLELPIHLAIRMSSSEEVMEALIDTTSRFSTPELEAEVISFASRCGASQISLRGLLTTWPSTINAEFKIRPVVFPLHEALSAGASEAIVQMLFERYPEVVNRRDRNGLLPLHQALRGRASETIIRQLIAACPSAVSEQVKFRHHHCGHPEEGHYPIHLAIKYQAPDAVLMLLINSAPQVVSQIGGGGNYPLHLAANWFASKGVPETLLEAYPRPSEAVNLVETLLEVYPQAVSHPNDDGMLPLHLALWHPYFHDPEFQDSDSDSETISELNRFALCTPDGLQRAIFDAYPHASQHKDRNGNYPLHLAVKPFIMEHLAFAILREHPEAVTQRNTSGDLPLHVALRTGAQAEIMQEMLNMCPEIICAQDGFGKFPWQISRVPAFNSQIVLRAFAAGVRAHDILVPTSILTFSQDTMISLLEDMHQTGRSAELMDLQLLTRIATFMGSNLCGLANMVRTNANIAGHYFAAGGRDRWAHKTVQCLLRSWHCGEVLWRMFVERSLFQVLPRRRAACSIASFLCGCCPCTLCAWYKPDAHSPRELVTKAAEVLKLRYNPRRGRLAGKLCTAAHQISTSNLAMPSETLVIEEVQHAEPPAQIHPSEAHAVTQELWMTSVQHSLKDPLQEGLDEATAGAELELSSHGSQALLSKMPSANASAWAEMASVQLSEDSWQASDSARPSNFGDTVHVLQVTRAPKELRQVLHYGRELESIRTQSREAGHSCELGSGGSIFLYPQQYTAVQAIVRHLHLKAHFLVVNEAFLPLVLEAIRSIPSKANVRPRRADFLALVDDEGHEVCAVKHSFFVGMAPAIVQTDKAKSEP